MSLTPLQLCLLFSSALFTVGLVATLAAEDIRSWMGRNWWRNRGIGGGLIVGGILTAPGTSPGLFSRLPRLEGA